ncbi:MAG TPA: biosynthetic-type acetolactate synthase large subunit [Clostridiales bacterium]|jgi:acetolactate synthase-1/2/3 large subunit|nr:biosynthetic-type acetolactate synthase large subunit [Clostridiales bacterium]
MRMTGAKIIVETLIEQGIDTIFGYPGGAVLNIYDELYKAGERISHYLTCHEQAAAHAADAYARVSGKPGVVIATSGPGATNLVTGIANAYLDSSPIIAITGNVARALIGKDSFQEVDIYGVTMPITKHNYIVKDVSKLADTIREAIKIATSGRPGPVLIDVPKDIQLAEFDYVPQAACSPESRNSGNISDEAIEEAVELIKGSKRPFIYAGGGVIMSVASNELLEFAELIDAPIGLSMMGLSAIPGSHPRNLGMTGMHGKYAASKAMSESDLIVAVGTRFSDRATGSKQEFSKGKKFIHIDIDPAEIGKNIPAYVSVIGNVKDVLTKLNANLTASERPEWRAEVESLKSSPENNPELPNGKLTPKAVIEEVRKHMTDDGVVATDVGQHQMWVSLYYNFTSPRTLVTSGGLGAMGFGMGAAVGSCIGRGKRKTVLFTGDGSFHMNLNELATAVSNNLPLVIVVMNNGVLGMVRQWQTLFFEKRYSSTTLNRKTDFVKLAEAFGATGYRISSKNELSSVMEKAFKTDGPVLIDAIIDRDEKVLPMIPPGGTINDIILEA